MARRRARRVCPKPGLPVWYWAQVLERQEHCWISTAALEVQGPADSLPVVGVAPIPDAPTGLVIAQRMCSPLQAYVVRLEWTDVAANEVGHRIYRDGALLEALPPNSASYTENPPYGRPYTNAVEAYNQDAGSPDATVVDEGCK